MQGRDEQFLKPVAAGVIIAVMESKREDSAALDLASAICEFKSRRSKKNVFDCAENVPTAQIGSMVRGHQQAYSCAASQWRVEALDLENSMTESLPPMART